MKNNIFKTIPIILAASLTLTGCNNSDNIQGSGSSNPIINSTSGKPETSNNSTENSTGNSENSNSSFDNSNLESSSASETNSESKTETMGTLQVRFGASGTPFVMHIYDNPTAAAIARHVGTARWQLPIYHYDDYPNWEVMQYYDIPSRYDIPSDPERVTSEKAGEVYYSEPNRIILFFGDAQVSNEYTPVGYFDPTPEFISEVENNPVLEGWGNKIVIIQPGD